MHDNDLTSTEFPSTLDLLFGWTGESTQEPEHGI